MLINLQLYKHFLQCLICHFFFTAAKMGRRTDRMRSLMTTTNDPTGSTPMSPKAQLTNNGPMSNIIESVQNSSLVVLKDRTQHNIDDNPEGHTVSHSDNTELDVPSSSQMSRLSAITPMDNNDKLVQGEINANNADHMYVSAEKKRSYTDDSMHHSEKERLDIDIFFMGRILLIAYLVECCLQKPNFALLPNILIGITFALLNSFGTVPKKIWW